MSTRQNALAKIIKLMKQHDLVLKDIAIVLKTNHAASPESSPSVITSVFNYIGSILLFAGLYVYLYLHWLEIGSSLRIMFTLGTGFCFFLLGTMVLRIGKFEQMATPLFIASALLQPYGIIVALKEYAYGGDFAYGLLFMSLVMFLQQGLVFYALRNTFLAFSSIIFGTIFFAVAFDLMGMNLHIEGILLGLSLMSIAWILDNSRHKAIAGIIYLFSGLALLFTTWDWIHYTPFEILFLGMSCSIILFSVIARSSTLLILGILTTMSYIVSYTIEHFAEILAWPFILMLMGIIVIGFSGLSMKINEKYQRRTIIKNKRLNIALTIIQEFGPNRCIPAKKRIACAIPDASENEIKSLIKICGDIESAAYNMAVLVLDKKQTQEKFKENLRKEYPFLYEEQINTTLSQALYFACK